jgi:hypothetical protein
VALNISSLVDFVVDPVSRHLTKMDLFQELIEQIIISDVESGKQRIGIVVSDGSQTTDNTVAIESDSADPEIYLSARIRIVGLHDRIIPDPLALSKQKKTYRSINQAIECHPVLFSKDSHSIGVTLARGQYVDIVTVGDSFRFVPTSRKNLDYLRIDVSTDPTQQDNKSVGIAQQAMQSGTISLLGTQASEQYDLDDSIPNKARNEQFISIAHPEFQSLIKTFIYNAWQVKIRISLHSTYRSPSQQQALYDAWINGTPEYQSSNPKPAKSGTSTHNAGIGFDFNPRLDDGTTLMLASPKQQWEDSGVVQIGKALGMRWGGDFTSNYDPIHFDIGNRVTLNDRKYMIKKATDLGVEVTSVPLPQ